MPDPREFPDQCIIDENGMVIGFYDDESLGDLNDFDY